MAEPRLTLRSSPSICHSGQRNGPTAAPRPRLTFHRRSVFRTRRLRREFTELSRLDTEPLRPAGSKCGSANAAQGRSGPDGSLDPPARHHQSTRKAPESAIWSGSRSAPLPHDCAEASHEPFDLPASPGPKLGRWLKPERRSNVVKPRDPLSAAGATRQNRTVLTRSSGYLDTSQWESPGGFARSSKWTATRCSGAYSSRPRWNP